MTATESRPFELEHADEPGRVIRGRVELPTGRGSAARKLPHVLLLHGFKGFMDWGFFPDTARRIAAAGFAAVRFNMSGSGVGEDLESFTDAESFARNTVGRELEDLARVRAWIREGGAGALDPERASLVGHSRGGGVALLHAAETGDCRCVVTWASVASFDRFDETTKGLWRDRGFLPIQNARTGRVLPLDVSVLEDLVSNRARYDLVRACGNLHIPALLLHGTADESVPFRDAEILCAALGEERARLIAVEGAGHTFGIGHPMKSPTSSWKRVVEATLDQLQECG